MRRDCFIRFPTGVRSYRQSPAHAVDGRGELVNSLFVRLAARVAVLSHPGTAFANRGVVPIAASAATA
jgi:hypothetical protein